MMASMIGRRAVFGTILAVVTGGVAMAQPMTGPNRGPSGGAGPGMMGGGMMHGDSAMMGGSWNTGTYLSTLKTEIGITPRQEPAWKDYAEAVSGTAEQMQGLHQTMFDAMGTASWQERRTMMNRMFEARQQAFDTVHEAAEKLLPVLDPGQRTTARRSLPGLTNGPGMMGRRIPPASVR